MHVETRYLLRASEVFGATDAGPQQEGGEKGRGDAYIEVRTKGWRTGPPEVVERLNSADPQVVDSVRPEEYSFRIAIELETGDERLAWLNQGMW